MLDSLLDNINYLILAVVQGFTEFLPVSSSGHLILINALFPIDAGLLFDIILHLATLFSVVIFYRRDIWALLTGALRESADCIKHKARPGNALAMVGYLLTATAITGIIGITLEPLVNTYMRSVVIVGSLLILNAAILWSSQKSGRFQLTPGPMNLKIALIIGLVQGIAVLPGISRSGSTITAALLLGVKRDQCAKFSFLLSIPVILGAVILHLRDIANLQVQHLGIITLAACLAAVIGYICLVLLEKLLKNAKFHYFAPYCLLLGITAILMASL